jgi:hypothetical protein
MKAVHQQLAIHPINELNAHQLLHAHRMQVGQLVPVKRTQEHGTYQYRPSNNEESYQLTMREPSVGLLQVVKAANDHSNLRSSTLAAHSLTLLESGSCLPACLHACTGAPNKPRICIHTRQAHRGWCTSRKFSYCYYTANMHAHLYSTFPSSDSCSSQASEASRGSARSAKQVRMAATSTAR